MRLLSGEIADGDHVVVDVEGDALVLRAAPVSRRADGRGASSARRILARWRGLRRDRRVRGAGRGRGAAAAAAHAPRPRARRRRDVVADPPAARRRAEGATHRHRAARPASVRARRPFRDRVVPVAAVRAAPTRSSSTRSRWGTWRQLEVRVFGATAAAPDVLGMAATPTAAARPTAAFAGVLPNLASTCPPSSSSRRCSHGVRARPGARAGDDGDVAFDARWTVWTDDPTFASSLLAPELRTWLRPSATHWGFELSARIAMMYGRRPDLPDVVPVLELLAGLLGRVPEDLPEHRPPAV